MSSSATSAFTSRALQREDAHGHAGEEVDVEEVDRLEQVAQLALRSLQDEQVAHLVDANHRLVDDERLEQARHFLRADDTGLGTITTLKPGRSGAPIVPSCGVTEPRPAIEAGTIL